MMETPSISATAYSSSVLSHDQLFGPQGARGPAGDEGMRRLLKDAVAAGNFPIPHKPEQEQAIMSTNARIVKIFIADSNENLPLEKRVLYSGAEQLTDLTDQELFFEVPISDLLGKHNAVRAATVDKKQAEKFGRDIFLEPARIRDLKMVVVTVAQF